MNVKSTLVATLQAAVAILLGGLAATSQAQVMTTLAGNGTAGYRGDGAAAAACELNYPMGVAVDGSANIYIADQMNNCIRKVTPAGIITTIAGTDSMGYGGDGGPATAARFNLPAAVAVDAAGNIFIADAGNDCIRELNTSGIISTIAGNGAPGYSGDGGPATAAFLNQPAALALDGAGNIYIADQTNNCIRKLSPAGIITTVAGNGSLGFSGDGGPATAATFDLPGGMAVDAVGNLLITDEHNNRIRMVSVSGTVTTIAGTGAAGFSGDGGAAASAKLYYPAAIATDGAGNILFTDVFNSRIRRISNTGTITTIAGTGTSGYNSDGASATTEDINFPTGLAIAAEGNIYIADQANNRIRVINAITSGIQNVTPANSGFSLYPNPAQAFTSLTLTSPTDETCQITITNLLGYQLQTTTIRTNHKTQILTPLPSGQYIISARTTIGTFTAKLTVQ